MSMISPYMSGLGYADLAYGGAAMASSESRLPTVALEIAPLAETPSLPTVYHPYGTMARYGYNSYSRPWYSSLYGGYGGGYGYGGYGLGYSGYRWPIAY